MRNKTRKNENKIKKRAKKERRNEQQKQQQKMLRKIRLWYFVSRFIIIKRKHTHWCEVQHAECCCCCCCYGGFMVKTALVAALRTTHADGVNCRTWTRLNCIAKWFMLYYTGTPTHTLVHSLTLFVYPPCGCNAEMYKNKNILPMHRTQGVCTGTPMRVCCKWKYIFIASKNGNDVLSASYPCNHGENCGNHFVSD